MSTQTMANNIFTKLTRIKHKDKRFARLSLEFHEAQTEDDLAKVDNELTEIVNEIEKKEKEQFGS